MMQDANEQRPRRALVLSGGGGRGAFQCGVIEQLARLGWEPDVLVGTSIGSMNAAVWAVGGTAGLTQMWETIRTRDMHRFTRLPPWSSLLDRVPWKRTLERYAPEEQLRTITKELYIVATDLNTGQPAIFTNGRDLDGSKPLYRKVPAITHEHLLASSAIPYVYAQTPVGSARHWDGAVVYNSPLRPAVDSGAHEIFIVLLSPYTDPRVPDSQLPSVGRDIGSKLGYLLDLTITATFGDDFEQLRKINQRVNRRQDLSDRYRSIKCALIAPDTWLSPLDIIRYDPKTNAELRHRGRTAVTRTWQRVQHNEWDSLV